MKNIMMTWNYRTILHKNSADPDHEDYETVHEFYFYNGDKDNPAFIATPAAPRSKEDAIMILSAYDRPPLVWVDDASYVMKEDGKPDWSEWGRIHK